MKKLILILIFAIGWGNHARSAEPYISPGLQIGFNSNKEFSYGLQLSAGVLINSKSNHIYSPSVCFGYKRIINSQKRERYFDFQVMSLPDTRSNVNGLLIPIGIGVGIGNSGDRTFRRIKGYTWFFSCITFDYNMSNKSYDFSILPVLPIASMM